MIFNILCTFYTGVPSFVDIIQKRQVGQVSTFNDSQMLRPDHLSANPANCYYSGGGEWEAIDPVQYFRDVDATRIPNARAVVVGDIRVDG